MTIQMATVPADAVRPRSEVRVHILDAALKLLASEGRDAVTTRTVSEAAGVQPPVLYRLFGEYSQSLAVPLWPELRRLLVLQVVVDEQTFCGIEVQIRYWLLPLLVKRFTKRQLRKYIRYSLLPSFRAFGSLKAMVNRV